MDFEASTASPCLPRGARHGLKALRRVARFSVLAIPLQFLVLMQACDLILDECVSEQRPADQEHRVTISQGIWGQVWSWEGNFMPDGCPGGKVSPVARTILIFERTTIGDATDVDDTRGPGLFIRAVSTALVDSVRSDDRGFFEVSLPEGTYSLLVREDSLLYTNTIGSDMVLGPAQVFAGSVTRTQIDIQFNAAF